MNEKRPIDVLLVGEEAGRAREALGADGLRTEVSPTCLDAIVLLSAVRARVVVLSAADVERRTIESVAGIREAAEEAGILLTLPPDLEGRATSSSALGADAVLDEPYFAEELLHRIRILVEHRRGRAQGRLPEGISPTLGSEALAGLIADIEDLNRNIPSLDNLADAILAVFTRRTRAQRASLLLYDRKQEELVIKRTIGLPEEIAPETRIPLGQGIAGRAAKEGKPLLVKDTGEGGFDGLVNRGEYRTRSCLSLPLMVEGTLLGVLNLADRDDGRPFEEDDLSLLARLAQQAALTLDNSLRLRRMRALSIIDDLTGLYNRRFFRRYLEREFRRAIRYKRPLTLAILDLDHFKSFNDLNGHEAGNRALKKIGDILRTSFRTTDIACRYGGEEFAVILPETEKGAGFVPDRDDVTIGAFRFLERVRARIEEEKFENEERLPSGKLTISGGVASYPDDVDTVEDLLEAADRSLYLAKAEGKNRVVLA